MPRLLKTETVSSPATPAESTQVPTHCETQVFVKKPHAPNRPVPLQRRRLDTGSLPQLQIRAPSPPTPLSPDELRFENLAHTLKYPPMGRPNSGAFGTVRAAHYCVLSTRSSRSNLPSPLPSPFDSPWRIGIKEVTNPRDKSACRALANETAAYRHLQQASTLTDRREHPITHPNVVRCIDVLGVNHRTMAIEYLRGGTLTGITDRLETYLQQQRIQPTDQHTAELIETYGIPILVAEAQRELFTDVIRGLAHIHTGRLLHNDLKSANVLLDAGTGTAKIGDLGEAKRFGDITGTDETTHPAHVTTISEPLGSIYTRSPEMRAIGSTLSIYPLTTSSDVWSLGIVFHEIVSGQSLAPTVSSPQQEFFDREDTFATELYFLARGESRYADLIRQRIDQTLPADLPQRALFIDLLVNILKGRPEERLSLEQIMHHSYFTIRAVPSEVIRHVIKRAVTPNEMEPTTVSQKCDDFDVSDFMRAAASAAQRQE